MTKDKPRRTGSTGLTAGMTDAHIDQTTAQHAQRATGHKGPTRAGNYYRKSYLLTRELIDQVAATAKAHQVGISELARWALAYVCDGLAKGDIELPTKTETRRRIDF